MKLDNFTAQANQKLLETFGEAAKTCPPVSCQFPPAHIKAHVSIPWAMTAAKTFKKPPLELAKLAAEAFKSIGMVSSVSVAPPGYVNVEFSEDAVFETLGNAAFRLDNAPGEKILLEFVSANPTGPLHLASGRAAALGNGLVRIFRALGYDTSAEYYINDTGAQAKLLGVSLKARYEGKEPPEDGYQGDYLRDMAKELPPEASGWNSEQFSAFAIEKLLETHKRDMAGCRVSFNRWFRESELHQSGAVMQTLEELKRRGKTYEKDGAVWFGSTAEESADDDKDRVLVRADGRPTYFLTDLAYHRDKLSRAQRLINILGADHHGYVPRMKAGMSALGMPPENLEFIVHQMVLLNKGGVAVKMSKRAGEFVSLREILDDIGVDACRFFFSLRAPNTHLNLDIDLAKKRSQENPVYYVQYVHARICSIFKTAEENGLKYGEEFAHHRIWADMAPQERALVCKLLWIDETLKLCARDLTVHHLANYLLELAGVFHQFYDNCRVVDKGSQQISMGRLFLCRATQSVVKSGLDLLGVSAPEQM
ncbi:MAG: arginine--tRNA ligase [Elusimicrobiales bacterium]